MYGSAGFVQYILTTLRSSSKIDYLKRNGMKELSCTISKNNFKSQALHRKCGFLPTNEPPVNCWGELEEGAVLFRLAK